MSCQQFYRCLFYKGDALEKCFWTTRDVFFVVVATCLQCEQTHKDNKPAAMEHWTCTCHCVMLFVTAQIHCSYHMTCKHSSNWMKDVPLKNISTYTVTLSNTHKNTHLQTPFPHSPKSVNLFTKVKDFYSSALFICKHLIVNKKSRYRCLLMC